MGSHGRCFCNRFIWVHCLTCSCWDPIALRSNSDTFSRTLEISTCTELCVQRADWKSDYWKIYLVTPSSPGIRISRKSTIVLASPSARLLDRWHHIPALTSMIRRSILIGIPAVSIFWDFRSLHQKHRVGGHPGCERREGLMVSERRFPRAWRQYWERVSLPLPLTIPCRSRRLVQNSLMACAVDSVRDGRSSMFRRVQFLKSCVSTTSRRQCGQLLRQR